MTKPRLDLLRPLAPTIVCASLLPGCVLPDPTGAATDTDAGTAGSQGTGADGADSSGGIPGDCTTLTQADVEADTTLPAGCYAVSEVLAVTRRLDVEGGAEMYFESFGGLLIGNGGVLAVVGTEDQPVVMTSSAAEGWQGVQFVGSASSDNRLEYVQIDGVADTAVTVSSTSRLIVAASEIAGAPTFGVRADAGAQLTVGSTSFTGNGIALAVAIDVVAGVGADNVFDGNDTQIVQVEGGTLADAAQWQAPGVPYRLTSTAQIAAALTLDPGVQIEMPQDTQFVVKETGSLSAVGTAEAPIQFRGNQDERGYWDGIGFYSKATANALSYCTVANGGADGWNGSGDSVAMIWMEDESKAVISDCTLRASDGPVLASFGGADISGFANNTIEDNRATVLVDAGMVHQIEASNRFMGNDEQFVRVGRENANNGAIDQTATWQALEIPYRVIERFFVEGAWTIEAGAVVEIAQDRAIYVRDSGSLSAIGTPEAPVIIRGAEALQGYWRGIEIASLSASNRMDYVQFSHAGSSRFNGSPDSDGSLHITNGSLAVANSSFSESGGYGVVVGPDGTLSNCTNVTFSGNAKADVYVWDSASSACP